MALLTMRMRGIAALARLAALPAADCRTVRSDRTGRYRRAAYKIKSHAES